MSGRQSWGWRFSGVRGAVPGIGVLAAPQVPQVLLLAFRAPRAGRPSLQFMEPGWLPAHSPAWPLPPCLSLLVLQRVAPLFTSWLAATRTRCC